MFKFMGSMSPLIGGQLMSSITDAGDLGGDGAPVDPKETDTSDAPAPEPETVTTAPSPTEFSWKGKLGEDLSGAPLIQGFEDTPEGLKKAMESHVNLEKLLGHEKVPLPKGPDDSDGIMRFNKAMGVPETAEGYNLPDASITVDGEKVDFDKGAFSKVVHENSLTPMQAQALWKTYTAMQTDAYTKQMADHQQLMIDNKNALMAEWGDAYAANVELGDMVISKFADDQETADFITATLTKDPAGIKFLAKIGEQFSENKVGEFQYKRHSLSPADALAEIKKIQQDPSHPYQSDNATEEEHQAAVDHVNRLISISRGKKPV